MKPPEVFSDQSSNKTWSPFFTLVSAYTNQPTGQKLICDRSLLFLKLKIKYHRARYSTTKKPFDLRIETFLSFSLQPYTDFLFAPCLFRACTVPGTVLVRCLYRAVYRACTVLGTVLGPCGFRACTVPCTVGTELSKIRLGILFLFDSITSAFQRKFEHKFTLLPGDISVVFMSTSKFRKS